jgi:hypothetical protein
MTSKNPRYLRIFEKLGYETTALTTEAGVEPGEVDMDKLRADYTEAYGKKPYMGWDAATLIEKINEKRSGA